LSGVGAAVVQWGWIEVTRPENAHRWAAIASLQVVVTGYLVCLAWFHAHSARWRANSLVQRLWHLGQGLACDLASCLLIVAILIRGHEGGVLGLGLWMIPPTLLAISAVSAAITSLAWLDGYRRLFSDIPPPTAPLPTPRRDWMRPLSWLVLLMALLVVEFGVPELPRAQREPVPTIGAERPGS